MKAATAIAAALALTLTGCAATTAQVDAGPAISAAVADTGRPAVDRERDVHRKPAEIVAFAGVKPGDVIAEIAPGGGYYTRILAKAVGPTGKVYALMPAVFANRPGGMDAINAIAAQYGNVVPLAVDFTTLALPEPVDLVWTTENYHDMANNNVTPINASAFKALKPGGIYFVEDHAALAGTGLAATSTLHRIDPAAVIEQVTAHGFKLEAQSDLLANPKDPKDVGVRDPSVQGETEKFALRFRKPR
jgi:predicted methyltransferase